MEDAPPAREGGGQRARPPCPRAASGGRAGPDPQEPRPAAREPAPSAGRRRGARGRRRAWGHQAPAARDTGGAPSAAGPRRRRDGNGAAGTGTAPCSPGSRRPGGQGSPRGRGGWWPVHRREPSHGSPSPGGRDPRVPSLRGSPHRARRAPHLAARPPSCPGPAHRVRQDPGSLSAPRRSRPFGHFRQCCRRGPTAPHFRELTPSLGRGRISRSGGARPLSDRRGRGAEAGRTRTRKHSAPFGSARLDSALARGEAGGACGARFPRLGRAASETGDRRPPQSATLWAGDEGRRGLLGAKKGCAEPLGNPRAASYQFGTPRLHASDLFGPPRFRTPGRRLGSTGPLRAGSAPARAASAQLVARLRASSARLGSGSLS